MKESYYKFPMYSMNLKIKNVINSNQIQIQILYFCQLRRPLLSSTII